jgi:peptidoglycan hydrolase CwlO-like protein
MNNYDDLSIDVVQTKLLTKQKELQREQEELQRKQERIREEQKKILELQKKFDEVKQKGHPTYNHMIYYEKKKKIDSDAKKR